MLKPNFFIVGAAKSGTTSLHQYLDEHPDIFMSAVKEPNYFTHLQITKQNLYYNSRNVQSEAEYLKIFSRAEGKKAIGEASVSYLFYPNAAKDIHDFNPKAKIIIILRNPINRAYSHFLMDKRLGYVDMTFSDIVIQKGNDKKLKLYYQQFVELGLYHEQVKRYIDVFGEKNVKIFLSEELKENPRIVFGSIFQFLNLKKEVEIETDVEHNSQKSAKNKMVSFLYRFKFIRKSIKFIFPDAMLRRITIAGFKDEEKQKMDEAIFNHLKSIYKKDLIPLETLIHRKLNHWYE